MKDKKHQPSFKELAHRIRILRSQEKEAAELRADLENQLIELAFVKRKGDSGSETVKKDGLKVTLTLNQELEIGNMEEFMAGLTEEEFAAITVTKIEFSKSRFNVACKVLPRPDALLKAFQKLKVVNHKPSIKIEDLA